MHELGSPTWCDALRGKLQVAGAEHAEPATVVQWRVGDGPAWWVAVGGGEVSVQPGEHPAPDIVMEADASVAEAIADGEQSALTAFRDGDLVVRGDVGRLASLGRSISGGPGA